MEPHRLAEARSLAYHREIARRIATAPALVDIARARVEQWLRDASVARPYAEGWSDALSRPISDLIARMLSPSPQWVAMRQCSPFAGILDARTRWRIHATIGALARELP